LTSMVISAATVSMFGDMRQITIIKMKDKTKKGTIVSMSLYHGVQIFFLVFLVLFLVIEGVQAFFLQLLHKLEV